MQSKSLEKQRQSSVSRTERFLALKRRIIKKKKLVREGNKKVCIVLTAVQNHIILSLILTEMLCRIQQTKQVMETGEGEKRILWILHLFGANIVDSAIHRVNHYLVDKCLKKTIAFSSRQRFVAYVIVSTF